MLSKLIEQTLEPIKTSSNKEKDLLSLILVDVSMRNTVTGLYRCQQQIGQVTLSPSARALYQGCVSCLQGVSSDAIHSGALRVWQLKAISSRVDDFVECMTAVDANSQQTDFEQRLRASLSARNEELSAVQKQADLLNTFCTLFQKFRKAGLPLF